MTADRVTLVTGFPGFCAERLVRYLLGTTLGEVCVVVDADGRSRAAELIADIGAERGARLSVLEGDPTAIDMGLSGVEYGQLARRVTTIQHFFHTDRRGLSKDVCEAQNVGGMREALELGRAAGALTSLVVHSRTMVSGDRTGCVAEADLEMGQRFVDPVEETLARAERMARTSMGRLPIVVLRTGQVVGDAQTGRIDLLDGVYLLILLILNSPQDLSAVLPRWGDAPINAVPVDHLVRVADSVGQCRGALGSTLQLVDERPMTIRTVFNRCMTIRQEMFAEGFVMPAVSTILRRDAAVRGRLQSILWRPRAFINMTFRDVRYETSTARRVLHSCGIAEVPLEAYFERLVRYVASAIESPQGLEHGRSPGSSGG